jgi:hypothetical protein
VTWMTRRPDPEPPTVPVVEHIISVPRLGRGLCWADLTAEMAAERTVPAPNPWTPTDPKEAA